MLNDETILAALLTAGSIRAAAKTAGVAEATVRNRMSDPSFRQRYDQLRGDVLQEVTTGIVAQLQAATETMVNLMGDEYVADSVRLNAADALLRHGLRYISVAEIERRLAALETAQAEEGSR